MVKKKVSHSKNKAPKQARSKDTVETILKAATRILGKEGPEGLNTNLIAKVAGVSVGSLYQYFRNKESVIHELLLRILDGGLESSLKVLDEDIEPEAMIKKLVDVTLTSLDKQGPWALYVLEAAPKLLGTKRFQQVDEMLIPKVLNKAREKGIKLRPVNPEMALFLCIQVIRVSGWSLVKDKGQKMNREVIARELTDLLCRYLLPDTN
ncbi:MAG: TetR/AcrR family transcriptional regulator [Bacteriovoracaceae bacterium]|nr:TetR/AcrR family transcriptional regulator [Bacteriovoracaceae bacterium]